MDHKINEPKGFFWQEPRKKTNKQLSSDGYCCSNDSYVKNQNRSNCYKNMYKVKRKSEHFWISALHCGLREKRLSWYKTVPGYKIWKFWFFMKQRDESSEVRKLREENSELEAATKGYETGVQLLLLDRLAKKQECRTHMSNESNRWRREDEIRRIWEQQMEEQDEELELEDNTHDINTDKLAKKYNSGATHLFDNKDNKQLANKYTNSGAESECLRWNQATDHIKRAHNVWRVSLWWIRWLVAVIILLDSWHSDGCFFSWWKNLCEAGRREPSNQEDLFHLRSSMPLIVLIRGKMHIQISVTLWLNRFWPYQLFDITVVSNRVGSSKRVWSPFHLLLLSPEAANTESKQLNLPWERGYHHVRGIATTESHCSTT